MTAELLLPEAPPGVRLTSRSLTVEDPSLAFEHFERLVAAAGDLKSATQFWIGDLMIFGEGRYGERVSQVMEVTGMSERRIRDYIYVCERVVASRRREQLDFSHHYEVAKLDPDEQERWLDRAVRGDGHKRWAVGPLRDAIQDAQALAGAPVRQNRPRQEVLDAPEVDAARNLGAVRETLALVSGALGSDEEKEAIGLPRAMRALDEAGDTIRRSARASSLSEAASRAVAAATRSSGFAMVPLELFDVLAAAVAAERTTTTEGGR